MRFHIPFILLLVLVAPCGCRKNINNDNARKAIIAMPQETLEKEDIDVTYVTQIGSASAVAETRVKTAFRLQKINDEWVVTDIRIGHGQWEKIEDLASALAQVKTAETRLMLDRIAAAVREYHKETGNMPEFRDYVALSDLLAPKYLDPLIRLDSWRKPLRATTTDQNSILVVSAGPDGRFTTDDDISITITP
jgi:hypothetical protein